MSSMCSDLFILRGIPGRRLSSARELAEVAHNFEKRSVTTPEPSASVLFPAAGGDEAAAQLSIPSAEIKARDIALRAYEASKQGRFTEAFSLNLQAAALGNSSAQYNLALAHRFGEGTAQSSDFAFPLYLAAAQAGIPQAMHNVGVYFDEGKAVQQDKKAAAIWYRKAADLGVPRSQTNLGLMLVRGEGIAPNENEGFNFLVCSS